MVFIAAFSPNKDRISVSCSESFNHFGVFTVKPSYFLRVMASFVRWEMRLRSISADNPKAKARYFV
jgi:hypothetical protein